MEIIIFGSTFNQALVSQGAEDGAALGRKHAPPDGLKHLHLEDSFDRSLSEHGIHLEDSFNRSLSEHRIPDGL